MRGGQHLGSKEGRHGGGDLVGELHTMLHVLCALTLCVACCRLQRTQHRQKDILAITPPDP